MPKLYIAALCLLILFSLVFGILLALSADVAGFLGAAAVFICSALLLILSLIFNKDITKYVTAMDKDIVSISRETFYDFPEPIIIVDDAESVIWYNREFEDRLFGDDRAYGVHLSDLVGNNTAKIFAQSGATVKILDRYYNVSARQSEAFSLSVIRFSDITDHVMLENEYKASRKTVMIMMVDNYDDVLQNAKESDKSNIQGQIEQVFERFIENTNGVIHKVANDRFYAIIEERHLSRIIERKFDILDEVRSIQVGDRSSVTLSIGVGKILPPIGAETAPVRLCRDPVYGAQPQHDVFEARIPFADVLAVDDGKKARKDTLDVLVEIGRVQQPALRKKGTCRNAQPHILAPPPVV